MQTIGSASWQVTSPRTNHNTYIESLRHGTFIQWNHCIQYNRWACKTSARLSLRIKTGDQSNLLPAKFCRKGGTEWRMRASLLGALHFCFEIVLRFLWFLWSVCEMGDNWCNIVFTGTIRYFGHEAVINLTSHLIVFIIKVDVVFLFIHLIIRSSCWILGEGNCRHQSVHFDLKGSMVLTLQHTQDEVLEGSERMNNLKLCTLQSMR